MAKYQIVQSQKIFNFEAPDHFVYVLKKLDADEGCEWIIEGDSEDCLKNELGEDYDLGDIVECCPK